MSHVESAYRLLAEGKPREALSELESGAAGGDAGSALELGVWLLEGQYVQRDLVRSRENFGRAADLGDATAKQIFISFVALGVGDAPNWGEALSRLDRSAHGDPLAAEQLQLLRQMGLTDTGDPVRTPAGRLLSHRPEASSFEQFFTPAECDYLISRARPLLQPSVIVDPSTGQLRPHPVRTSEGAMFPWVSEDLVIHALNRRIATASATDVFAGEPLQVLRYSPGQQYHPHIDALPSGDNQRILTMLVYLNDDYEGGETQFTRTGLTFGGRTGDALLFRNATSEGSPDEMAQHAGLPLIRGEKYLASRWIRERPFPRT